MKLARFTRPDGKMGFGVADSHEVADLSARVPSFAALLASPVGAADDDPRYPVDAIRWLPPLSPTSKIMCVGFNFANHAIESSREVPAWPTLFARYPDSFVGADDSVVRPLESEQLDWEGEAALVIGAAGRRIPGAEALAHVAGYTCMAENSVRDWQFHSGQAIAGKSWAASGALGPWVTTADEVADRPLIVTTRLNGEIVQHDATTNLTFSAAELIAYISAFTPLRTGDVIALGTPAGVGFRREPPRFLRPGDVLEVQVEPVGILRHTVVDDADADASLAPTYGGT